MFDYVVAVRWPAFDGRAEIYYKNRNNDNPAPKFQPVPNASTGLYHITVSGNVGDTLSVYVRSIIEGSYSKWESKTLVLPEPTAGPLITLSI